MYLPDKKDRSTRLTMYVLDNGYKYVINIDGSCSYWLRPSDPDHQGTFLVGTGGGVYESDKGYGSSPEDSIGVRPAIWVEF